MLCQLDCCAKTPCEFCADPETTRRHISLLGGSSRKRLHPGAPPLSVGLAALRVALECLRPRTC